MRNGSLSARSARRGRRSGRPPPCAAIPPGTVHLGAWSAGPWARLLYPVPVGDVTVAAEECADGCMRARWLSFPAGAPPELSLPFLLGPPADGVIDGTVEERRIDLADGLAHAYEHFETQFPSDAPERWRDAETMGADVVEFTDPVMRQRVRLDSSPGGGALRFFLQGSSQPAVRMLHWMECADEPPETGVCRDAVGWRPSGPRLHFPHLAGYPVTLPGGNTSGLVAALHAAATKAGVRHDIPRPTEYAAAAAGVAARLRRAPDYARESASEVVDQWEGADVAAAAGGWRMLRTVYNKHSCTVACILLLDEATPGGERRWS